MWTESCFTIFSKNFNYFIFECFVCQKNRKIEKFYNGGKILHECAPDGNTSEIFECRKLQSLFICKYCVHLKFHTKFDDKIIQVMQKLLENIQLYFSFVAILFPLNKSRTESHLKIVFSTPMMVHDNIYWFYLYWYNFIGNSIIFLEI